MRVPEMQKKAKKIHVCPSCGGLLFSASVSVTQTWAVDEEGNLIKVLSKFDRVIKGPTKDDSWNCRICGGKGIAVDSVQYTQEEAEKLLKKSLGDSGLRLLLNGNFYEMSTDLREMDTAQLAGCLLENSGISSAEPIAVIDRDGDVLAVFKDTERSASKRQTDKNKSL